MASECSLQIFNRSTAGAIKHSTDLKKTTKNVSSYYESSRTAKHGGACGSWFRYRRNKISKEEVVPNPATRGNGFI